jgi:hypothetical protein
MDSFRIPFCERAATTYLDGHLRELDHTWVVPDVTAHDEGLDLRSWGGRVKLAISSIVNPDPIRPDNLAEEIPILFINTC